MKNFTIANDPFADLGTVEGPAARRKKSGEGKVAPKRKAAPMAVEVEALAEAPPAPKTEKSAAVRKPAKPNGDATPDRDLTDILAERAQSRRPGHRDLRRSFMGLREDLNKLIDKSTNHSSRAKDRVDELLAGFETHLDKTLSGLPEHDGELASLVDELVGQTRDLIRTIKPSNIRRRLHDLSMFFSGHEVDDFGRDEVFLEKVIPLLDFLYRKYWRVETTGVHNVPSEGRALLVANHSGVLPFDGAMITYALKTEHPAERVPRFLAEDFVATLPFLSSLLTKTGQIRACQENAERLLNRDEMVGVFPEGVKGIGKYFRQRYQVQRFGRGGMVRLCLRTRTPVIPVSVVGAEEIYPLIGKSTYLARLTGLPFFPVTVTWPFLGPLGLIPLPAKWSIHFGEPIHLETYPPEAENDDLLVNRLNEEVRNAIQAQINETLKHRRSVWFG